MLTKNISFKNFSGVKIKKSIFVKKTFFDKNKLIQNYPLLKSFSKDYNYSYKKNDLKKFKKFRNIDAAKVANAVVDSMDNQQNGLKFLEYKDFK